MCPTFATKERSSFERTVLVHEITIKSLKDSCFVNFFVVRVSIEFKYKSSINLLAFYREWRSLIGYATHYLFCDRQGELEKAEETLACGSCSHSISRSFKLPLAFLIIRFYLSQALLPLYCFVSISKPQCNFDFSNHHVFEPPDNSNQQSIVSFSSVENCNFTPDFKNYTISFPLDVHKIVNPLY